MLIIPAMHISDGQCTRTASGEAGTEGKYPCEPSMLARLWRVENAKSLHLVDEDGLRDCSPLRTDLVRMVVDAVDIPVQLAGSFTSVDEVRHAFMECGIYRIVLGTDASHDYEFVATLVSMFGPRRIVVTIDLPSCTGCSEEQFEPELEPVASHAESCRQSGVQRAIVEDTSTSDGTRGPRYELLYQFAERSGLSLTIGGGVRDYRDLKNLQDLHPVKIDSIILHDALYSNSFPCQKIWRLAEKELIAQHRLL